MKLKLIIATLIISNLATGLFLIQKEKKKTSINSVAFSQPYFHDRDKLFSIYPADSSAIVFLGDSETNDFDWSEYFQNIHIKNRGIRGDNTDGIFRRLQSIMFDKPEKIFLQIGINDLAEGIQKDTILSHYKLIINTIRHSLPNTQLFVISLFPVADSSKTFPGLCTHKNNELIKEINDSLRSYTAGTRITYIDVYKALESNGHIKGSYSINDGLHLNKEGYKVWTSLVKKYLFE